MRGYLIDSRGYLARKHHQQEMNKKHFAACVIQRGEPRNDVKTVMLLDILLIVYFFSQKSFQLFPKRMWGSMSQSKGNCFCYCPLSFALKLIVNNTLWPTCLYKTLFVAYRRLVQRRRFTWWLKWYNVQQRRKAKSAIKIQAGKLPSWTQHHLADMSFYSHYRFRNNLKILQGDLTSRSLLGVREL